MQVRDDAAIGEQPGVLEDARKRFGIGRLGRTHAHF
jgi:hypothetical protein